MTRPTLKTSFIVITTYLFILLFVYAAVSKLLDYENFKVQLGQSPMLGSYATFFVWSVPIIELLIAFALSFKFLRRIGLMAAYMLMLMFTAYIYIILHYSSFVPCSCGGVLEKMSWKEHLIFNAVFIVFALLSIFFTYRPLQAPRKTAINVGMLTILGITSVIGLFKLSENKTHFNNDFTRLIPHKPVKMLKGISLKYNSFYIAGYVDGKIYLGNKAAPKYILEVDTALTCQNAYRLHQDNYNFNFVTAQVRIKDQYYYFADGTIPVIYRGLTSDWRGQPIYNGSTKFTSYEVIDTASFTVKAIHPKTGENFLALVRLDNDTLSQRYNNLLDKKYDGVFDTDGLLSYNPTLKTTLYTYYYRNQYLLTTPSLDSVVKGKTIDTLQHVDLKFVYLYGGKEKKFAKQPEKINTYVSTSGNYLYIKSKRLGRYERSEMLNKASIIDVYQLNDNSYKFSFYLYNYNDEEIRSFQVYDDIIVALTDQYLVVGRFRKERFNPLE